MTNYTVNTGDNLWNIVKREFKLTSNSEIAKKVKKIAQDNNLSNPDRIFTGQIINLGATDTVDLSSNANNSNGNQTNPINENAANAANQRIANGNIKTYSDLENLAQSSVSLWGTNTLNEQEKKQAYTAFSEELLKKYYDLNNDGTVTVEEFAEKERSSSLKAGEIQANELGYSAGESERTISQRTGNVFAQNLDFNGNGNIDAEELAFFNKEADGIDGKYDGIITNAGESSMFDSVTGINADNEEYNRVVKKYFRGETLTPEEQETLKNCQKTIRTNIGRAAGINIEG